MSTGNLNQLDSDAFMSEEILPESQAVADQLPIAHYESEVIKLVNLACRAYAARTTKEPKTQTNNGLKTITIQIGNSDDKLTQSEWSNFVARCAGRIECRTPHIHFSGGSSNWNEWQNYAWVIMIEPEKSEELKRVLEEVRKSYRQESIAWTEGETQFI